jgi:isoleucyl-tRNA synthetase
MGVDVMRWMFAKARPEENILFGWHAADEARRELLVLWNVYAFFVRYARLAGWSPAEGAPAKAERHVLDRWILSRAAATAAAVGADLDDFDAAGAARTLSGFIDDLSTWYLRLSRRRFARTAGQAERSGAFATLQAVLLTTTELLAPILPFMAESVYDNLSTGAPGSPDSVHLTSWPATQLAGDRDEALEASMGTARRAVELSRTLRSSAGIRTRQPLAQAWLAAPGGATILTPVLLQLVADEANVRRVSVIDDEHELVERRVKPLLPRIGKRLGSAIPAVMAAARAGEVEFLPDGGVRLAGIDLAADEVEIQAAPRPGTAVAADDGLVVVLDTTLDDDLRLEGDVREVQRAIQDLRRTAGLELDDRIRLWLGMDGGLVDRLAAPLREAASETLASEVTFSAPPVGAPSSVVEVSAGRVTIGLERTP